MQPISPFQITERFKCEEQRPQAATAGRGAGGSRRRTDVSWSAPIIAPWRDVREKPAPRSTAMAASRPSPCIPYPLCGDGHPRAQHTTHQALLCGGRFSRGPPATHRVRNVQPLSMAQLLEVSRPSSLAVPAFFHALLLPACRILFLMPNFSPHTLCLRFTCQLLTHLQVRRCVQVVGARRVGHRRPSRPSYRAGQSNQLAGSASISSRSS